MTDTAPRSSLADEAYRQIEALIVRTELAPGAWITESAVAERIGLGRTPVREAIQRLCQSPLVEITTGRGPRVTDIDLREQLLIIELRREIERLLARRAARFVTEGEHGDLVAIKEAAASFGPAANPVAVLDLESGLQRLLLRCARHRFAAEAIRPLWSASRRFCWVFRTPAIMAAMAEAMIRLVDAVLARDEAAAERAAETWLGQLEVFARSTLERRPILGPP
jgi:DNA-binding GntR family transcriptional regulator